MESESVASPSFIDRLLNVFSSPSDAFEGHRESPSQPSLWLIPLSFTIVLTIVFTYLLFSNETLRSQMADIQGRAMEEQVQQGALTQAQADQIRERMENVGLGTFMVFGALPAVVFACLYFFGGSFFLWLTSKVVLKNAAGYMKYVELYGLAAWIGILGFLVTILMILGMGSLFASPSAALAIMSEYDPLNKTHRILSAINIFTLWQVSVVGIGLSKLSGRSVGAGIALAFSLWVLWLAVAIPLGLTR
jgi:hypothetical protein